MNGSVLLAIGLVGQWLFGFAMSSWIIGPSDPTDDDRAASFVERSGLGFVLGVGGTAGVLFLWSMLGGRLGPGISFAITVVGFLAGGILLTLEWRRVRAKNQQSPAQALDQVALDQSHEGDWCGLCLLVVTCLVVSTTVQILMTPQHLWDERASFAIKGIVLSMDGSINSHDLLDPNFVQYHPRYPLLIPLAEQHIYSLLGHIDDRFAKLMFPMLYAGLVLTMAGGLARELSPGSAWFFALLTATMPVLVPWEYGFLCGQADASMACFHGISVLYLWLSWRQVSSNNPARGIRTSILAGICGAMAAFTKDEGIAFLMVDAIAVVMVMVLSRQFVRGLTLLVTVFGIATVLLAPWMLHRQHLPLTTEANYFGRMSSTDLSQKRANLEWQVQHLTRRMFWEFREWGLQWWLMVFGGIAAPRKVFNGSQLFLVLDVIGSLLSLMLAGMLAATEVTEHIGESSHRYLMQLAPTAILFAAGQLGLPRRRLSSPPETSRPAV